jgi:hypothetical protein
MVQTGHGSGGDSEGSFNGADDQKVELDDDHKQISFEGIYTEDDVEALGEILALVKSLEQSEARAKMIANGIEEQAQQIEGEGGLIRQAAINLFSAFGVCQPVAPGIQFPSAKQSATIGKSTKLDSTATVRVIKCVCQRPSNNIPQHHQGKQSDAGSRLFSRGKDLLKKRDNLSRTLHEECTFVPKLNPFKKVTKSPTADEANVFEKLYSESKLLTQKQLQLQDENATLVCVYSYRYKYLWRNHTNTCCVFRKSTIGLHFHAHHFCGIEEDFWSSARPADEF